MFCQLKKQITTGNALGKTLLSGLTEEAREPNNRHPIGENKGRSRVGSLKFCITLKAVEVIKISGDDVMRSVSLWISKLIRETVSCIVTALNVASPILMPGTSKPLMFRRGYWLALRSARSMSGVSIPMLLIPSRRVPPLTRCVRATVRSMVFRMLIRSISPTPERSM